LVPHNFLILGQCSEHVKLIIDVPYLVKEFSFFRDNMMWIVGELSDRRAAAPRRDALGAGLAVLDLIPETVEEVLEEFRLAIRLGQLVLLLSSLLI
jgi:hypothetical protein